MSDVTVVNAYISGCYEQYDSSTYGMNFTINQITLVHPKEGYVIPGSLEGFL